MFIEKIKKLFTEHPNSVDEGYFVHMLYALMYAFGFACCFFACTIHAFFPFLFQTTASTIAEGIVDSARYRSDDI